MRILSQSLSTGALLDPWNLRTGDFRLPSGTERAIIQRPLFSDLRARSSQHRTGRNGSENLKINGAALFQTFKYIVYVLLAMNIYWFYSEESAAAVVQFANGVALSDLIEAYSATIDTAAWVVLLLMFELETYVLDERHFTRRIAWSLHGLRAICYAAIIYAFFGYVANLTTLNEIVPLTDVTGVCALLPDSWSWAVTLDDYVAVTAAELRLTLSRRHSLPIQ